jgi:AraC-like DNA-binding protein
MSTAAADKFVPPADPAATWRAWVEHLNPVFDATAVAGTRVDSAISICSYNLGTALVGTVSAPAQRLERSARKAAQQGVDHVLVQIYQSGTSRVRGPHGETEIKPSDFVVYDLARPIELHSSPVTATNILLPRALLGPRAGAVEALHGRVFSAQHDPVAQLFSSYLGGVVELMDKIGAEHLPNLAEAATKLCVAALPGDPVDGDGAEKHISLAVRAFILNHLDSPDLGPEMICARFGVSRATLYRQFAADDGIQHYIRERRLAQAMRILTRTDGGPRPRVSSVAYATGFSSEKTFSRAFKQRFGFLPREASARPTVWPVGSERGSNLGAWIRQLDL